MILAICYGTITPNLQGEDSLTSVIYFNEIKNIKHEAFDCTFSNLKFEQEIRHGFHSTFILKCEVSGLKEKIFT